MWFAIALALEIFEKFMSIIVPATCFFDDFWNRCSFSYTLSRMIWTVCVLHFYVIVSILQSLKIFFRIYLITFEDTVGILLNQEKYNLNK